MADFAPPAGPPPPQLPPGWKAIWNDQYQAWFYANTVTKETTWEKPTEAAYPDRAVPPPDGAPPAYDTSSKPAPPEKSASFASNNPYGNPSPAPGTASPNVESDEAMARRLQQEQMQGSQQHGPSTSRGAADNYYDGSGPSQQGPGGMGSPSPYGGAPNQLPPREENGKRGLFSKLSSKFGGSQQQQRPPQHYGGGGGYPPQGYGGGPPQGYGGYPQQPMMGGPPMGGPMYGGYPQQPMYGGYPQQGMYGQPQRRQGGGGLGAGGGAALGVGAGMMGGMMMGSMMAGGGEQDAYQDGYDDGMDAGDDGGGDE